jgi:hypothetical protein
MVAFVHRAILGLVLFLSLVGAGCTEKYAQRCAKECKANGHCTGVEGQKCAATSDGDCERADVCTAKGWCGLSGTTCVATAAGCRASAECRDMGLCGLAGSKCVAVAREDCVRTEVCKREGRCTPQNGECVPTKEDCEKRRDCTEFGKCTPLDYQCSTATAADCARSSLCKEQGYCTFQDGSCALLSDGDCKQTRGCREEGRCFFRTVNANKGLPQAECVKKR